MYLIRRARNSRHQTSQQQQLQIESARSLDIHSDTFSRPSTPSETASSSQSNTSTPIVNNSSSTLLSDTSQNQQNVPAVNRDLITTSPETEMEAPLNHPPPVMDRRFSALSVSDTLVPDMLLGHHLSEFNSVRLLPIVSIRFQRGLYVFASNESFKKFKEESNDLEVKDSNKDRTVLPLLHVSSTYRTMFKKNSPFLIIHKFQQPSAAAQTAANTGPQPATNPKGMNSSQNSTSDSSTKFWDNKFEYCKVYFKQQAGSITSYKLKFQPCGQTIHESNFQIMMYYHPTKPFVDTVYKKTRLRWIGFSPNAQQHTDSFKVIVLSKDSPSLVDGTIDHFDNNETDDWDNDESLYPSPNALNARSSHDDLFAMLSSMLPVADYTTSANYLLPMKSMTKKGEVSLMDCVDGARTEDLRFMREHALVLTCMALVLRDHEVKKAQSAYGRTPYNGVTTESAAL